MLNGIYQNASSMTGLETWNNAIAQNLAQSSVPGYKRATVAFEGEGNGSIGVEGSFGNTLQRETMAATGKDGVDFSSGSIVNTDIVTDFAIEGDGFFELKAPDGQFVYTRDGQFKLNEDAQLVSKQGFQVMDAEQNAIQLTPGGGKLKGMPDGMISQDGRLLGTIAVKNVDDPSQLIRSHGGFVTNAEAGQEAIDIDQISIRHAALENSNVSSTTEMVNLIQVSRAFQLNQQVVRGRDELLGKAIQTLGGRF